MNKSQRASETQSIKRQIANIHSEIKPILSSFSLRSNPRSKTETSRQWIQRTVRLQVNTSSSSGDPVTFDDLARALGRVGTSEAYTLKVLGIKAWNASPPATTTNRIQVETSQDITISAISTNVIDYGCLGSLPGVGINIPDLLSKSQVTSSTATVCTLQMGGTAQLVVVEVRLLFQM